MIEGYVYRGFHIKKSKTVKNYADAVAKITKIRNKRAQELRAQRARRGVNLKDIWVRREDSIQSGNCQSGTDSFISLLGRNVGQIGGIRADYLLEIRNDRYTVRAVEKAKEKYMKDAK